MLKMIKKISQFIVFAAILFLPTFALASSGVNIDAVVLPQTPVVTPSAGAGQTAAPATTQPTSTTGTIKTTQPTTPSKTSTTSTINKPTSFQGMVVESIPLDIAGLVFLLILFLFLRRRRSAIIQTSPTGGKVGEQITPNFESGVVALPKTTKHGHS